jgi:hypothetical protein
MFDVAAASSHRIAVAREGRSSDLEEEAALRFVRRVVERRDRVEDADLAEVRGAGSTKARSSSSSPARR